MFGTQISERAVGSAEESTVVAVTGTGRSLRRRRRHHQSDLSPYHHAFANLVNIELFLLYSSTISNYCFVSFGCGLGIKIPFEPGLGFGVTTTVLRLDCVPT